MTHVEVEWPSQQNIQVFSYFAIFLVPLANTISAEPSPESLPLGGLMLVQGERRSGNLYSIHNTVCANCPN